MNDILITFDTAKLAKEKGFKRAYEFYKSNGNLEDFGMVGGYSDCHDNNYAAPTQANLQKWLRDEYNIHIEIQSPDNTEEGWKISSIRKISNPFSIWDTEESFDNYEKALEMGLQATLNLI